MNEPTKIGLRAVGAIIALGALSFGGLYWAGFLGKHREALRTGILKESQAWTDGKKNELNRLYLEYQKADTAGRIGISNVARDSFAVEDTTSYPQHLQKFLSQIGAKQ